MASSSTVTCGVYRKQNVIETQKQRQKCHDEIKQVRNRINEHLDNLEQRILQDLYAAEKKVKSQIEDLLGKLAENAENINSMENNISAIKDYATDLQTFLGSKMIEIEIKKYEIFMQSLFDDESLRKMDINCKIEDKLTDVMSNVTSLGTISIELSSPLEVMQIGKATQAQTMSLEHVSSKTIDEITMTLQSKFDFFYTTGCSISSTGYMVLIEFGYRRLLILKEDGTLKSRIPLSTLNPVDCACVDDKTVAVTFAASKQLQIINV
ncbi:unnamed protein product [Mytilus coruscus]|uniref:Uncharacterized protein n=1 Tax=Mytilus coruscus TaxID=42192 RepID=A0A6J8CVP4_MYTCO|nr:unnamed protein product [Mytilus coruscus]